MTVQEGARYFLFGERLIAVGWTSGEGEAWTLLHDVRTDTPCYRVMPDGSLERCMLEGDQYTGVPCDATVDDLVLAVAPAGSPLQTYAKITMHGGGTYIQPLAQLNVLLEEIRDAAPFTSWTITLIQMDPETYAKLPDFAGH